tara:strand:- start:7776 stop:8558 length:783 start_codon:yes stop_codon:yes gene_type:complete
MLLRLIPLAALSILVVGCSAPRKTLSLSAAPLTLSGEFGASAGAATVNSTVDELGLGDEELGFYPRFDADWDDSHFSIGWLGTAYEGTGVVSGDVTIDGSTIPSGTTVDTRMDLAALTALYTWDIVPIGPADLGIGLGVTLLDIDLEMISQADSTRLQSDEILPLPVLTARLDFRDSPFAVGASVGGIDVSFDEGAARVLDLDVHARLRFSTGISGGGMSAHFLGGYRSFSADGHYDDGATQVDADVRMAGPYLGLSISF